MTIFRYHEAVLQVLEQDKSFDGDKVKAGLNRQEAWIKSLYYILVPDMWGYYADRYYLKLYCCGLLQRSLKLYLHIAGQKAGHLKGTAIQKAGWEILYRIITLAELIRSLEAIYDYFDTINESTIEP